LHASYPTSGRQRRFVPLGLIDDYTDNNGMFWSTWNMIVLLPDTSTICHIDKTFDPENPLALKQEPLKSITDIRWLLYNGQWGRKGRKSYGESDGPYGPGMKVYFRRGDVAMTLQNCIGHEPSNGLISHACSCLERKSNQTSSCVVDTMCTTVSKPQQQPLTPRYPSDFPTEGLCFELKVFNKNFVEVDS